MNGRRSKKKRYRAIEILLSFPPPKLLRVSFSPSLLLSIPSPPLLPIIREETVDGQHIALSLSLNISVVAS